MDTARWCWLAAFAVGCGGGVSVGAVGDASFDSDASDAGGQDKPPPWALTLPCGMEPHSDAFCAAWADQCRFCGISATSCEREHFDEMCVADEAFRSDAWRAAVIECGTQCLATCVPQHIAWNLTSAEAEIANRFCAQCPLGPPGTSFGASPGVTCVQAISGGVAVSGWSDAIWVQVAGRCLPTEDAGTGCEADFWKCANETFKAAHGNVVCNAERRNWW